jgi:hypothetical protein
LTILDRVRDSFASASIEESEMSQPNLSLPLRLCLHASAKLLSLAAVLVLVGQACNWTQGPAAPTEEPAARRRTYIPVILTTPAPAPTPKPTATPAPPNTPPEPTPTSKPTPRQPDPDDNGCHSPDQIRIKVHVPDGPNGAVMDSVALTCDRKFCSSYKLPGGKTRDCCPLGPEGSDQRGRCEDEMVPRGPRWEVRGRHHNHPNNPWLHFVDPPATVRACLPQQGICSDWLRVN